MVGDGWFVGVGGDGNVVCALVKDVVVVACLAGVMIGVFLFVFLALGVDVVVVVVAVFVVDVDGGAESLRLLIAALVWVPLSLGEERVPEMITSLALEESSAFANAFVALLENFIGKIYLDFQILFK